jgi:hypothetical protein
VNRNRSARAVFMPGMLPLAALLLVVVASSACATEPNWSWRQAPRDEPAARTAQGAPAQRRPVQPKPVHVAQTGPRRELPQGPPTYSYGAKFEPPDGRVLHGMGNWITGNLNYLAALGDPALEPAASTYFVAVGDWPRPWETQVGRMAKQLATEVEQGRMLHVGIEFWGIDGATNQQVPVDVIIARGSKYDDHIRDLARTIRDMRAPTFVRLGAEFSGAWTGYSPLEYPKAFRRTVEIFREEQVDNAAFVWCWEPAAPGDFDEREQGAWRWYPGDDVVDWFGIDLYNHAAFEEGNARSAGSTMQRNLLRFLDMAEQHGKPVLIGESGAVTVGITPDAEDGRRDWDTWFEPYFRFIAAHPSIKAFFYDNSDWKHDRTAQSNGWKDGDIAHNDYIAARYAQEMRDPMYLHKRELHLVQGFPKEPLRAPPMKEAPARGRGDNGSR